MILHVYIYTRYLYTYIHVDILTGPGPRSLNTTRYCTNGPLTYFQWVSFMNIRKI